MQLGTIVIENFLSIENVELDFPKGLVSVTGINKDVAGSNSNGSGKSALFDAICWVLFGNTLRPIDKDSVIRRGTDQSTVTLSFDIDKTTYVIERTRGKSTSLSLVCGDKDLTGSTISITQDKVNSLLGMDYKTFLAVATFDLDILRFARATDKEQKEILERILSLEIYGKALEKCRKEITEKENTLLLINENKKFLQSQWQSLVKEKNTVIDEEGSYYKDLEAHKQAMMGTIDSFKKLNASLDETIKKAKEDIEQYQKIMALPIKQTMINELNTAKMEVNKIVWQLTDLKKQKSLKEMAIDSANSKIGQPCKECGQPIPEQSVCHIVENNAEEALKLMDQIDNLEKKLEVLNNHHNIIQDKYDKEKIEQDRIEKTRSEATFIINSRNKTISQSTLAQRENEQKIVQLDMETRSLEAQGDYFSKRISDLTDKITQIEKQIKDKDIAYDIVVDNLAYLKYWEKGFGYQGIRSVLLDDVCQTITTKTNNYLKHLMGGTLWVECQTQSMTKTGERKEKFEIQVFNSYGSGTYYGLSKGEAQRVDFCLALALQGIAKNRNKNPLGFAIFDEVMERLDSSGCDQIISLLHKERNNLGTVFIISNNENLTTNFRNKIHFVKQNGVTKYERN